MSYIPVSALVGSSGTLADGSVTIAKLGSDVTGALDGKQPAGNYALTSSLTWSNLGGKPATFTPAAHGHVISDVTGLQGALDGKQPTGSYLTSITSGNVTTALGYTPTSVTGLTGSQTLAAFKTGLGLTGTNSGDQDLSSYATTAALTSGLATKQASGTYATGTGSASGTNTGDETKATIDTKIGATGGTTFYRKDGTWAAPAGGTGSDPWAWSKLAADVANSTVTLATAGLSFEAAANSTYIVRIVGGFTSAATTTGIALALDVPTGCIVAGTGYHMTTAAGASAGFEQIADNATIGATTGVRAAATLTPIEASWIIETGATAGTVTLMFRSEIAGSAVTLKKPFGFGVRLI